MPAPTMITSYFADDMVVVDANVRIICLLRCEEESYANFPVEWGIYGDDGEVNSVGRNSRMMGGFMVKGKDVAIVDEAKARQKFARLWYEHTRQTFTQFNPAF